MIPNGEGEVGVGWGGGVGGGDGIASKQLFSHRAKNVGAKGIKAL